MDSEESKWVFEVKNEFQNLSLSDGSLVDTVEKGRIPTNQSRDPDETPRSTPQARRSLVQTRLFDDSLPSWRSRSDTPSRTRNADAPSSPVNASQIIDEFDSPGRPVSSSTPTVSRLNTSPYPFTEYEFFERPSDRTDTYTPSFVTPTSTPSGTGSQGQSQSLYGKSSAAQSHGFSKTSYGKPRSPEHRRFNFDPHESLPVILIPKRRSTRTKYSHTGTKVTDENRDRLYALGIKRLRSHTLWLRDPKAGGPNYAWVPKRLKKYSSIKTSKAREEQFSSYQMFEDASIKTHAIKVPLKFGKHETVVEFGSQALGEGLMRAADAEIDKEHGNRVVLHTHKRLSDEARAEAIAKHQSTTKPMTEEESAEFVKMVKEEILQKKHSFGTDNPRRIIRFDELSDAFRNTDTKRRLVDKDLDQSYLVDFEYDLNDIFEGPNDAFFDLSGSTVSESLLDLPQDEAESAGLSNEEILGDIGNLDLQEELQDYQQNVDESNLTDPLGDWYRT